jgi:putative endonuclease
MPEGEKTGVLGERLAAAFLEAKGYTVLERNYRFSREEVDLVCFQPLPEPGRFEDGGWIVFVEVKTRRGSAFGRPEEAVDVAKQRAILRVAEAYLHERRLTAALCRFDVVAVTLGAGPPAIEHFENAFGYFL